MSVSPISSLSVNDLNSASAERLATDPRLSEEQKIGEVARQFEAVLLRQILGAARKTVISSGVEHDSATSEVYRDLMNTHLADSISQSGSFGLAKSLEVQLQRQNIAHPPKTEGESLRPPAGAVPAPTPSQPAATPQVRGKHASS